MPPHWGTAGKVAALLKSLYLESWWQVVLQEPELDWRFCVFKHWKHHNPGEGEGGKQISEKKTPPCPFSSIFCFVFFICAVVPRLTWGISRTDGLKPPRRCWSRRPWAASAPPPPLRRWTPSITQSEFLSLLVFFFFLYFKESLTSVPLGWRWKPSRPTWSETSRSLCHFPQFRRSAAPRFACRVFSGP